MFSRRREVALRHGVLPGPGEDHPRRPGEALQDSRTINNTNNNDNDNNDDDNDDYDNLITLIYTYIYIYIWQY